MVRCPVCDSATVTVVLNSKPHAACSCCGATWIQEGSWQRSIRSGRRTPLPEDVIRLPAPAERERRSVPDVEDDPAEEAVGS